MVAAEPVTSVVNVTVATPTPLAVTVAGHSWWMLAVAATFANAANVVLRDAKGYGRNTFKIDLARRGIARALTQAARGTPQSQSSKKII